MREQQAVHTNIPRRTHRPDVQIQGASRHHVGTSSGIHPEDRPFLTNERQPTNRQPTFDDGEDDDALYRTRLPTSARRYAPATTPPRTIMRVTQHQGPPPMQRASRTHTQAPINRRMWRLHPSVYVGLAMLVMLIGWIALSSFAQWWHVQQDTLHYGTPRTFQIDADVKHGGLSHFTVENLNGHIVIYELVETNMEKTHLYLGPILSGAGADLQPATVSFVDLNGDGYPDMVISIGNGRYVLINDHSAFRPVNSSDHISETGV
ncbi:MAG: hypothetical protein H0V70_23860 [Ktedonobacteraceae bacterium]|nr:hypothetical protein [Ktedonobacteraceae bacterium]